MLDTDISSYVMKRSDIFVMQRLELVPISDVCISAITKSELLYGVEVSPRRSHDQIAVEAYLRQITVEDYPSLAAAHYASIRASLKKTGKMIGANDLLIAAHARSLGLTLVTNNTREFMRVDGLEIANWTQPWT